MSTHQLDPKLKAVLDNIPGMILFSDSKGNCTYCNKEWLKFRGVKLDHEVNGGWRKDIHPEDHKRINKEFKKNLVRQKDITLKFRIKSKDGSYRWLISQGTPWYSDDKNFLGYAGFCTDIHEQTEAQLNLENYQNFLVEILDNLPLALFCKDYSDGKGSFIVWNKQAKETWGFDRDEVFGKSDADFFDEEQTKFFREKDLETLRSGKLVYIPKEPVTSKEHGVRIVKTWKVPVKDSSGKNSFLLGISQDITQLLKIEKELEEQRVRAALNSRLSAIGQMAGGIAHEINNPLTIIQGYAYQLEQFFDQKEFPTEKAKQLAIKLSNTAERISSITKGLRFFARDAGNDPIEKIELKSIVEDSLLLLRTRFEAHNIDLQVGKIDPKLKIECRPMQISQVIMNFLNNAYDSVHEIKKGWVSVNVVDDGKFVKIMVEDNGKKPDSESIPKLFEPFFTTKTSGKTSGQGLGLSICKGIADSHNGDIYMDQASRNTRFVLHLPKYQTIKSETA